MAKLLPILFVQSDLKLEVNRLRTALTALKTQCERSNDPTCLCANCQTFRGMRDGIAKVLRGQK